MLISLKDFKPFVTITADELVFGYNDSLVNLAHNFYPKKKRPRQKMGLLINVRTLILKRNNFKINQIIEKWNFKGSAKYLHRCKWYGEFWFNRET